jgi:chitinase
MRSVLTPLLLLAACAVPSGCASTVFSGRPAPGPTPVAARAPGLPAGTRIVGYYASWGRWQDAPVAAIRAGRLTHLVYAFADVSPQGTAVLGDPCGDVGWCDAGPQGRDRADTLGGSFREIRLLRERHPHLRVLMAVGGWTRSGRFSDVALTPASRRAFARSAVELFIRRWPGVFDGIDVDWEYPVSGGLAENRTRPEDRRNFTLLLEELRRELDAQGGRDGRRYLLTAALPAPAGMLANFELDRVHPLLDWINLMAYDFHSGGTVAHHNAPLYAAPGDPTPQLTVDASVRAYLAAGVPREKLVVGIPFYGIGYAGVPAVNHGLYQTAAGPVAPQDTLWTGGQSYRKLMARDPLQRGFRRFWSEEARVPWMYNPATKVWVSYDDPRSLGEKAGYVRQNRLGGVMIWEVGGDVDGALLEAVYAGVGGGG